MCQRSLEAQKALKTLRALTAGSDPVILLGPSRLSPVVDSGAG